MKLFKNQKKLGLIERLIVLLSSSLLSFLISFHYIIDGSDFARGFGFFCLIASIFIFYVVLIKLVDYNSKELSIIFKDGKDKILKKMNFYNFLPFALSGLVSLILLFKANNLILKAINASNMQEFDKYFYLPKGFYKYGVGLMILSILLTFILQVITISKLKKQNFLGILKSVTIPYIKFSGLLIFITIGVAIGFFILSIIMNLSGGAPFG